MGAVTVDCNLAAEAMSREITFVVISASILRGVSANRSITLAHRAAFLALAAWDILTKSAAFGRQA